MRVQALSQPACIGVDSGGPEPGPDTGDGRSMPIQALPSDTFGMADVGARSDGNELIPMCSGKRASMTGHRTDGSSIDPVLAEVWFPSQELSYLIKADQRTRDPAYGGHRWW